MLGISETETLLITPAYVSNMYWPCYVMVLPLLPLVQKYQFEAWISVLHKSCTSPTVLFLDFHIGIMFRTLLIYFVCCHELLDVHSTFKSLWEREGKGWLLPKMIGVLVVQPKQMFPPNHQLHIHIQVFLVLSLQCFELSKKGRELAKTFLNVFIHDMFYPIQPSSLLYHMSLWLIVEALYVANDGVLLYCAGHFAPISVFFWMLDAGRMSSVFF